MLILKTACGTIDEVLGTVSEIDADFTGENGEEYLWYEARGFNSNMEFLLHKTAGLEPQERVGNFINRWLGMDNYFYNYDYVLTELENNKFYLSLAVVY